MSVEKVLEKISAHNADVLGCIATVEDRLYDNLPDLYDLVNKRDVAEHAQNMFAATDALETEHDEFDQLFLEFQGHSIYARRLDDGVLVLLNQPVERAQFKKMQIGVNLFMKPLKTALAGRPAPMRKTTPVVPTRIEPVTPAQPEQTKPVSLAARIYRGVRN